jgi:hypothetical protein
MLAFLLDALTYNVLFNFSSEFSKIIMLCVHRHYSFSILFSYLPSTVNIYSYFPGH